MLYFDLKLHSKIKINRPEIDSLDIRSDLLINPIRVTEMSTNMIETIY
jgi:hypothetical protein